MTDKTETEEYAEFFRKALPHAVVCSAEALVALEAGPPGWRGSPIFERDYAEARAALVRIRLSAEEALRMVGKP